MQAAAVATPSGMTSVLGPRRGRRSTSSAAGSPPHGRLWKANLLGPGNIVVSGETAGPGRRSSRSRPSSGPSQVDPPGRRRRVPLRPDEAGRRAARRGPGRGRRSARRASPSTRTSTPPPTPTPTTSAGPWSPRSSSGVRWEDSMRRMLADGFDTFYEIGPGRVLTGLLKRIDRKTPARASRRGRSRDRSSDRSGIGVEPGESGRDYNRRLNRPVPARIPANRPHCRHRMSRTWPRPRSQPVGLSSRSERARWPW